MPAVDHAVQVDYYGAMTPLKSLASIAVPDASTLLISPFDKGSLKDIEKAINNSDIGINPNNDGQNIRLNIPAMTQVSTPLSGLQAQNHRQSALLRSCCLIVTV